MVSTLTPVPVAIRESYPPPRSLHISRQVDPYFRPTMLKKKKKDPEIIALFHCQLEDAFPPSCMSLFVCVLWCLFLLRVFLRVYVCISLSCVLSLCVSSLCVCPLCMSLCVYFFLCGVSFFVLRVLFLSLFKILHVSLYSKITPKVSNKACRFGSRIGEELLTD